MTNPSRAAVRVVVPASSANLGPGFDALGLALALHDTVDVRVTGDGLRVRVMGEGADAVPADERNLVVRALHAACDRLGLRPAGLDVVCRNAIPHSRGLGSSAAATVAGIAAGYALAGRDVDESALQLAGEFEGHADNAAASLFGGLVLAWQEAGGYRAVRLAPHPDVRPIALVPAVTSETRTTRGLLPERVPHADAAFTAARAALAVHALTAQPRFLFAATEDRLHQDYRESAWPDTAKLIGRLRAAGIPAVVSGAGPTVLVLLGAPDAGLPGQVDLTGFSPLPLDIDRTGVRVESLPE